MVLKNQGFILVLISLLPLLVACPGSVPPEADLSGIIWNDLNANGEQDGTEAGLAGFTVYLDSNNNAQFDEGEPSTTSSADGSYQFDDLENASYTVRQVLDLGWRNVSGGTASTANVNVQTSEGFQGRFQRQPQRIVGGREANIADYPFMVALGDLDEEMGFLQFCGGVLISDTQVLTAAHCSVDDKGNPALYPELRALLGTDTLDGTGALIEISAVTVHPQFEDVSLGFDVAIWDLAKPATLTDKLYTVEILTEDTANLAEIDVLATSIGWGALASGGSFPETLQQVNVPISDSATCQTTYADIYDLANFGTQLCAGVPEGGIDSCQGDSGGPLLVRSADNKRWLQAGITSWGEGCAFADFPGIYARTSALSAWILKTLQPESRTHTVTFEGKAVKDLNFGNVASTRPYESSIEPRWQLTNFSATNPSPNPNTSISYTWRILDEGSGSFSCALDVDGEGSSAEINVPCQAGDNSYTYTSGYPEGIYQPSLNVSQNGLTNTRTPILVSGNPVSATTTGNLATTDATDVDFPDNTYYIDYLELTDLPVGELVLIRFDSDDISPFLILYDKDQRDPKDGGGVLQFSGIEIVFRVEADVTYLLGVSSFDEEEVGNYNLSISSGDFSPFSF